MSLLLLPEEFSDVHELSPSEHDSARANTATQSVKLLPGKHPLSETLGEPKGKSRGSRATTFNWSSRALEKQMLYYFTGSRGKSIRALKGSCLKSSLIIWECQAQPHFMTTKHASSVQVWWAKGRNQVCLCIKASCALVRSLEGFPEKYFLLTANL